MHFLTHFHIFSGYGHIAPKTRWGRIITMIYAIFGIPLTILCLSIIGSSMASVFKFVYKNFCLGFYRQCRRFRAYLDSDEEIPLDAATAAANAVPNVLVAAGAAAAAEEANIATKTGFSSGKTVNLQNEQEMWKIRRTWPDGGDYRRNSSYMRSIPGRGEEECLERAYLEAIGTIEQNERRDQNKEIDDEISPDQIEDDASISENRNDDVVRVPVIVSLFVFAAYIFLGAFLFSLWEKDWDYLVGSYFCFITLSTIGFGDVVPGSSGDSWASAKKQALCSLYLLFGMAMTVMCIKLMQQEVRLKFTNLGRKIGLIETDDEEERKTKNRRKTKKQKEAENVSECKNHDNMNSDMINLQ